MQEIKRVIALGFFDGVHLGHGALLRRVAQVAEELKAVPAALTFADHVDELTQVVFKNNFTSRAWESYSLSDHKIPYSNELFDAGSLFFANMGDTVTLGSPVSGRFVRLDFAGFPILGLWHAEDTGAPFLCIEPWESVPTYHDKVDDLETKAMMNRLLPGSVYEKAYTVTVG